MPSEKRIKEYKKMQIVSNKLLIKYRRLVAEQSLKADGSEEVILILIDETNPQEHTAKGMVCKLSDALRCRYANAMKDLGYSSVKEIEEGTDDYTRIAEIFFSNKVHELVIQQTSKDGIIIVLFYSYTSVNEGIMKETNFSSTFIEQPTTTNFDIIGLQMTQSFSFKNVKEISRFLLEESLASCQGKETHEFNLIGNEIKHHVMESTEATKTDNFLVNFLSSSQLVHLGIYRQIKEMVIQQQIKKNISSVYWTSVEWDGEIIRYPCCNSEINQLPQDYKILLRHRDKTCQKFLDFAKRNNYTIFKSVWEDDYEEFIPSTPDEVWLCCQKAICAELSGNFDMQPVYYDDFKTVAYYEKQASIYFNLDDDFYRGKSISFCLRSRLTVLDKYPL